MTLRVRLAMFLLIAVVSAVVAQSVLGYLEFERTIYKDLDGDLGQYLDKLATKINTLGDLDTVDYSYENYVTRVRIMDGNRLVKTLGKQFPIVNGSVMNTPKSYNGWRFQSFELPGLGQEVRLEGAINSEEFEKSLIGYRITATQTAIVFSGLGAMLALFLSGRVLRPLDSMLEATHLVASSGDLNLRVPNTGPQELIRLSNGFNTMLERLQAYQQRETEFTRHASHELRTPLTAMGLELSAYREGETSAEEAINTIEQETKRMTRLTEALLLLAREDKPKFQSINLCSIVEKYCNSEPNITCEGTGELMVQAEAPLINRALENLLENANKYAPGSPINIKIEKHFGHALLCVADTGPGMKPESMNRATEMFFRGKDTTNNIPGSGVGLSVVRRIMEAHNGQVKLEPVVPHGLKVILEFPLST